MPNEIAVTFDYLCPFARNAHEALVYAVRDGFDVPVQFRAFSLNQAHVEEGEPPVWEREPDVWGSGVTALLYGIAVRDNFPDQFFDFHLGTFALRHDQGAKLLEPGLREVAANAGIDVTALAEEVWSGRPLKTLEREHTESVDRWKVFGVPTFIAGDEAVFVRFMERGNVEDLHRAIDLIEWTRLNEFKRTRIPR
ncbi:MAG TPA: DsbA family protein [Acidimicrobiales bacterium]|nr:DsbA family protein [Acidimicrobiales bacterium]